MALARIITRSQTCSRELSLVLLARGYTVEVVSPDQVPDNIADLELRVDAGPGNQLLANVETHRGEHSASLKFVHHLQAPMVDVVRQPEPGEVVHSSSEPVSFNPELGVECIELPVETQPLASRTISPSPAIETLPNREFDPEIDPEEDARVIAPPVLSPPVLSLAKVEPPAYFAVENAGLPKPTIPRPTTAPPKIVLPIQAAQRRHRSARWPGRAALAFVGVVLLAVVLGFSVRRISSSSSSSKGAGESSQRLPIGRDAASIAVKPLSAVGPEKDSASDAGQISAVPWPLPVLDSDGTSSHGLKEAPVAKDGTLTISPPIAVSRRRSDDVVARNTITYFDKRYEPTSKAKRPQSKKKVHP